MRKRFASWAGTDWVAVKVLLVTPPAPQRKFPEFYLMLQSPSCLHHTLCTGGSLHEQRPVSSGVRCSCAAVHKLPCTDMHCFVEGARATVLYCQYGKGLHALYNQAAMHAGMLYTIAGGSRVLRA